MKVVSVDFDGVIRSDNGGPVPGAPESLRFLLSRFYVFILTASPVPEVIKWLAEYGFQTDTDNGAATWSTQGVLLVTNRKLSADMYVDDKALRFWNWNQTIRDIELWL